MRTDILDICKLWAFIDTQDEIEYSGLKTLDLNGYFLYDSNAIYSVNFDREDCRLQKIFHKKEILSIENNYIKSSGSVYYIGYGDVRQVTGVNLNTFEIVTRDKNHNYLNGKIVQ